jgi:tetratricopeptide (TPR) repeat protein
MTTPMTEAAVIDELIATYAAGATRSGPLLPLAALIARLRESRHTAQFWAHLGEAMIRGGFAEPAAAVLASALEHYPDDVELHYLRGNALRVSQRYDEAEQDFRQALSRKPAHRQASLSLAFMLREHGRINAAAEVALALWRHHRDDPALALALLDFLRDSGAHIQANAIAEAAHAYWPDNARIAAVAGEVALALGDFAAARKALRRAVEIDPGQSSAWLRLSYCQRCEDPADADLALIASAWRDARLAPPSRICAGFAIGKLRDDLNDFAGASSVLREANALARAASRWNPAEWHAAIEQQIASRSLPPIAFDTNFVPVFVVGLPRSGTTLVATRLARHRAVRDRGELNWIAAMHAHLVSQDALHDASALQTVATLIATQMRRDDASARCYIDKNPLNFRYLNLIQALFPNARIVHCRRGARDTALSLWSQHFAHPDLGFTYDFPAIADVTRSHERLMARWRATLPLTILDVAYEDLVADPEAQFDRLAGFLDLSDAPVAANDDIAAPQVISTASVWQARQPVYTHAVGRWRRYAEFVPELAELFEAEGLRAEGG